MAAPEGDAGFAVAVISPPGPGNIEGVAMRSFSEMQRRRRSRGDVGNVDA
tara:strand:- start:366 stop:515 length:150 start_codon:yes stop_codon:yes gene_type:complete